MGELPFWIIDVQWGQGVLIVPPAVLPLPPATIHPAKERGWRNVLPRDILVNILTPTKCSPNILFTMILRLLWQSDSSRKIPCHSDIMYIILYLDCDILSTSLRSILGSNCHRSAVVTNVAFRPCDIPSPVRNFLALCFRPLLQSGRFVTCDIMPTLFYRDILPELKSRGEKKPFYLPLSTLIYINRTW
jgi:hypothetical protein